MTYLTNTELAGVMEIVSDQFASLETADALAVLGLVADRTIKRRPPDQRMETVTCWAETLVHSVRASLR